MSIQIFLEKFKEIQSNLLEILDNDDNDKIITFDDQNISKNPHEIKLFLRLISCISNNHHRTPNFFNKIETILKQFHKEILEYFSNSEIFDIFQNNKRILLFLIKEKLLILDHNITKKIVTERKYAIANYPLYFAPEIKPFMKEEWFPHKKTYSISDWFEQLNDQLPIDFEEKRMEGELDSYLGQIIRKDLIDQFVIHVNKTNLPLDSIIKTSKFETNHFLIRKSKLYDRITLIEYAAFYGSIQIFNYLRLNNVELKSSLWPFAIHSNNPELIYLLEENKVLPEDKTYEECFIEAIKCHHNSIVEYFENVYSKSVSSKMKQVLKYHNYEYIQNSVIKNYFLEFCKYDYYLFVKFLIENEDGVDINMQLPIKKESNFKDYKFAAIHLASKKNNIEIVKLLLSTPNIDVNIKTSNGFAALHYAAQNCNIEILKCLLSVPKINVNIQNFRSSKGYYFEYTPLHFAIEKNDIDIVKLLLSMPRIDVNIQTSSFVCPDDVDRGFTALHLACLHKRIEIVKLLLSMPDIDVNIQSSKSGKDGDNFYSRSDHEGFTALHLAVENNCIEIVKLLLKMKKIDVNIQTSSNKSLLDEFTPLHFAAENNNTEMVKLLLSMPNINVNLRTYSKGFTALHFACVNNNAEMVKLLLSHPNINVKIKSKPPNYGASCVDHSYRCMTPLKVSIENKNFEIINLLAESKKVIVDIDAVKKKIEESNNKKFSNRRKYLYANFDFEEEEEEEY